MRNPASVGLVALLAIVLAAPPASATFPGTNGKIAFSMFSSGEQPQIGVVDPDGTGETALTSTAHRANYETGWSADGTKIAFGTTSRRSTPAIRMMDPDGANPSLVVALSDPYIDVYHPSWSPDGSHIAFCAQTALHVKILTVLTDGSGTLTKLSPKRADDCYPDWSPDGTTIAFMAFPSSGPYEIWKMDADGHNRAKLATGATPSWSPDGAQIAFTKKVRKRNEVFTMNAGGSGITRITHSAKRWEFSPAFSPDGTEIAYSRTVGTHFYDTDNIWTIPAVGGTPTQLIDTPTLDEFGVSWQPIPIP